MREYRTSLPDNEVQGNFVDWQTVATHTKGNGKSAIVQRFAIAFTPFFAGTVCSGVLFH